MGFSTGKSKTGLETETFPGLFGTAKGAEVGGQIQGAIGQQGAFQQPFEQAVLSPEFGPQTQSENELLNSIMELTQGTSALRGLGPATQGSLAQNLAPALIGLRKQQVGNLGRGVELGQGGQGQILQALLQLAGLSMPQIVSGQTGSSSQFGLDTGISFAPIGG